MTQRSVSEVSERPGWFVAGVMQLLQMHRTVREAPWKRVDSDGGGMSEGK